MASIKAIFVGGSAISVLPHVKSNIPSLSCVALDSNSNALSNVNCEETVLITDSDYQSRVEELRKVLSSPNEIPLKSDSDNSETIVILVAGLGGRTGSYISPILAQEGLQMGYKVSSVVTLPFSFEGKSRKIIAQESFRLLQSHSSTVYVLSLDSILRWIDKEAVSEMEFFKVANSFFVWKVLASLSEFGSARDSWTRSVAVTERN
jgi:cell division protein FtsZ